MTLEELNRRFEYKTDKEQYGVLEDWKKLEEIGDKLVGDCESYAITVKREVDDEEYDFSSWDLYWCRLNGSGHCVLSNGYLVIDNNVKNVVTVDKYMGMDWIITEFRKFTKFEVFGKYVLRFVINPITRLLKSLS